MAGWLALGVAVAALLVALGAYFIPQKATRKAFKALEREVDDMWEKVESHLGRVSRLKRSMTEQIPKPEGLHNTAGPERILTRANLLARARRPA